MKDGVYLLIFLVGLILVMGLIIVFVKSTQDKPAGKNKTSIVDILSKLIKPKE
jgi:hypothetical protein